MAMEADAHGGAFSENGHKKTTVRVHRGLVVIIDINVRPFGQCRTDSVGFFNGFF